jgi:hypothetical protein
MAKTKADYDKQALNYRKASLNFMRAHAKLLAGSVAMHTQRLRKAQKELFALKRAIAAHKAKG